MNSDNLRQNNFDFLRLILAVFVVISHSYILAGSVECDWLCRYSSEHISLSYLGVAGFFCLSGYLVHQSLIRSQTKKHFIWKRCLRIFPGLGFNLVFTILIAIIAYEGIVPLWENTDFWTFLPKNLTLYKTQFKIAGVFENNYYKSVINGSLWTLRYEFTFYLVLLILFKNNNVKLQVSMLLFLLVLFYSLDLTYSELLNVYYIFNVKDFIDLGAFFLSGVLLSILNISRNKFSRQFLYLATFIFILSLMVGFFQPVRFFVYPLLIVLFGSSSIFFIKDISTKIGDLSYGIYIYGFPVQQFLEHYFKFDVLPLFVFSLLITTLLAYLSWRFIEKKFLFLKNKIGTVKINS